MSRLRGYRSRPACGPFNGGETFGHERHQRGTPTWACSSWETVFPKENLMTLPRLILVPTIALGLLAGQGVASAGFVGTTVSVGHYVPLDSTPYDGPYNLTVVSAGSSDGAVPDRKLLSPFLGCSPAYGVTVLDDSVVVDFVAAVNFTAGSPFHGLIVTNLIRPGSTASIVETDAHTSISYDGSTLKLDWQGLAVPAGATYTISFTAGDGSSFTVGAPCSAHPLGACTACSAGPSPLCAGVDAGSPAICPLAIGSADAAVDVPGAGPDVADVGPPDARGSGTGGAGGTAGAGGRDATTGSGGMTGAGGNPGSGGTTSGSGGAPADASADGGNRGASSGCGCDVAGRQSGQVAISLLALTGFASAIARRRRRDRG
jgi:hypothetical protein